MVVVEDHVDSSQQAVEVPQGVHPDPPEVVEDPGDVLDHVPLEVEEANLGIAEGVNPADDVEACETCVPFLGCCCSYIITLISLRSESRRVKFMKNNLNSLGIDKKTKDTVVVVAMSGGVDSSTVAGLSR